MSVDQMKMKVDEAVDEGIPKLAEIMKKKEVQEQIRTSVIDYLEEVLKKDFSDYEPSAEGREKLSDSLTELTVGFLRSESTRNTFLNQLDNILDSVGDKKIGELLDLEERSALVGSVSDIILNGLRSKSLEGSISDLVSELSRELRGRSFGPLSIYVEESWIENLRSFLSRKTVDLLVTKMPEIMNALDVSTIVEEEVEEFSLRDVEGLILDVTGNQLRSITWFGAIIGFVIGLVQLGIIWLGG